LLAGDVGRLSEMNLIERNVLRPVDLLVVPHHGSKSSSSEVFLKAVQPRLAVIPVGHRNRYGHPHAEVLARYRQHDIRVMRTDREGAVTVYLNNSLDPALGTVKVESARDEIKRYWHADQR
jgi:competence protein ComEC